MEIQNKLCKSVAPVCKQNKVIHQPANMVKKVMCKIRPTQPTHCLVKGCTKSFKLDNRQIRQKHIKNDHQNTVWPCALCPKQYKSYPNLDRHYKNKHCDYQCAFVECEFTSKLETMVIAHYQERHVTSDLVNNPQDNQDNEHLSEHLFNSEENVQPSKLAQKSISSELKTMKRTAPESLNNEFCTQVGLTGQGQSSVKICKFKNPSQTHTTQSRVARNSEQTVNPEDIPTKEVVSHVSQISIDEMVICIRPGKHQCAFPECTFTSPLRISVSVHYIEEHNICRHPGCEFQLSSPSTRAQHERGHDSIFPIMPVDSYYESNDSEKCDIVCIPHIESSNTGFVKISDGNPHWREEFSNLEVNVKQEIIDETMMPVKNMWKRYCHSIGPKCMVKDCDQSFESRNIHIRFEDHLNQDHQNTDEWHCAKCPEYFIECDQLTSHYLMQHLGHYKCAYPNCGFTNDRRKHVKNHYQQQHQETTDKADGHCEVDGHSARGLANFTVKVEPIEQDLTEVILSQAAHRDNRNKLPIVTQQSLTSTEPTTMGQTFPEP